MNLFSNVYSWSFRDKGIWCVCKSFKNQLMKMHPVTGDSTINQLVTLCFQGCTSLNINSIPSIIQSSLNGVGADDRDWVTYTKTEQCASANLFRSVIHLVLTESPSVLVCFTSKHRITFVCSVWRDHSVDHSKIDIHKIHRNDKISEI